MKSFNDIRENTITEAVDYEKLKQLARYGLVDKSNVTKLIAAFKKMEDGKILQPAQRELMLNVLTDLTGIITGDSQMFMKAKKAVSEEVESITELTAEEKRLVNTMYDKKGNLTAVGKKVMDHGKKNRFPHNTSATQGQRMGGKSTMYSEDALIDEKYDTPVKKKPVSMMSKAEKDKNDERRKAYKDHQKSLRKEDTQIDEARPSQRHPLEGHPYHKKTNAELEYIGKDAHKAAKAMKSHNPSAEGKYLDQANDSATVRHFRKTSGTPDWYKKKYGHSMKEEAQIDEISMTKMAAYAPKAVKSRNDAKAATHSADSNRVANAKKVIAKRKAGADNYNKKMWGYANVAPTKESLDEMGAFMSSPLPTPMSMRKEPSMTKPLMLTKKMNTAATLIKKAGNTPVSPRTEATYSDTGWQKPEVKKDKFGNVIKTKNVAKTLAKSGLRQTKDMADSKK